MCLGKDRAEARTDFFVLKVKDSGLNPSSIFVMTGQLSESRQSYFGLSICDAGDKKNELFSCLLIMQSQVTGHI